MTLDVLKQRLANLDRYDEPELIGGTFVGRGCYRAAYSFGPWVVKQAMSEVEAEDDLTPVKQRGMAKFGVQPCPTERYGKWEIQPKLRPMLITERRLIDDLIYQYRVQWDYSAVTDWDCHGGNIMVDDATGIFYAVDW